jgi:hypothetical protein
LLVHKANTQDQLAIVNTTTNYQFSDRQFDPCLIPIYPHDYLTGEKVNIIKICKDLAVNIKQFSKMKIAVKAQKTIKTIRNNLDQR